MITVLFGEYISKLKKKCRPLSIVIINKSESMVVAFGNWFECGKMFSSSASEISPSEVGIYNVSNSDGSIMIGVRGELTF